jgi:hypothetical protein
MCILMCADGSRGRKASVGPGRLLNPFGNRVYNLLKQQTSTSCLQAFTKLEISKHGTGAQISVFILRILAIVRTDWNVIYWRAD